MPLGTAGSIPLFISGAETHADNPGSTGYIPLYVHSACVTGYFPIFVSGGTPFTVYKWMPLYTYGVDTAVLEVVSYLPLYVQCDTFNTSTSYIPLYIEGDNAVATGYIPIYVEGTFNESGYIPIYVLGGGYALINRGAYDNDGSLLGTGEIPIYLRRQTFSEMIPIFVMNEYTESSDEIPLYTYGVEGVGTGEIPLYVYGFDTILGNIPLYIRGRS